MKNTSRFYKKAESNSATKMDAEFFRKRYSKPERVAVGFFERYCNIITLFFYNVLFNWGPNWSRDWAASRSLEILFLREARWPRYPQPELIEGVAQGSIEAECARHPQAGYNFTQIPDLTETILSSNESSESILQSSPSNSNLESPKTNQ